MRHDELNLIGWAQAGAAALAAAHPEVVFTSGRRNRGEQANAMASNVALGNRRWIVETYKDSAPCRACQAWVNAYPQAKTAKAIAAGLLSALRPFTDQELTALSLHLVGLAFDVQPIGGAAGATVEAAIRALPGLDKFRPEEAGLLRWHAQFHAGGPATKPDATSTPS